MTHAGGSVIIASGQKPDPLTRILAGESVGDALPRPRTRPRAAWKRLDWPDRPPSRTLRGRLWEREMPWSRGREALSIGILDVVSEFDKGDVVGIRDDQGQEFARGLTNYATAEARLIRGLRTEQARQSLEETVVYDEVVHKDNLVLIL